jgi:hypothetical protein
VQERDSFSLGANSGLLVDEPEPRCAAPLECAIQVVDGEADVVNAGSSFFQEPTDG